MATAGSSDHLCEEMLKILQCPVCFDSMEAPILQCESGHSYCSDCISRIRQCAVCKTPIGRQVRNYSLEKISEQVKIACQKREHKCRLSFSKEKHNNRRTVVKYICPMSQDTHVNCTWKGSRVDLVSHAKTVHASHTRPFGFRRYSYPHHFHNNYVHDVQMFHLGRSLFVVTDHYSNEERKWSKVVQLLGVPNTSVYQYQVRFYNETNSKMLTYTGKIHSEEKDVYAIIHKGDCFSIRDCEMRYYLKPGQTKGYFNDWKFYKPNFLN